MKSMDVRKHLKEKGIQYVFGLAAATLATSVFFLARGCNGSVNSTEMAEKTAEVVPEDRITYGPKTLMVEKFVDANDDGQPDDLSQVKRFRATYTERTSGNSMVFSSNGVFHECIDNEHFTPLEKMTSEAGASNFDKLERIEVRHPGGTYQFNKSDLDPATVYGEVGLDLFNQTDKDYAGVRPLFRDEIVSSLRAVTTDLLGVSGEGSKIVYRVVEDAVSSDSVDSKYRKMESDSSK